MCGVEDDYVRARRLYHRGLVYILLRFYFHMGLFQSSVIRAGDHASPSGSFPPRRRLVISKLLRSITVTMSALVLATNA